MLGLLAMTSEVINIDFDKVLEVALNGVRRAAVFMGLGRERGD